MEQRRLLLAIVLSTIVFLGWSFFFVKPVKQGQNKIINEKRSKIEKEVRKAEPVQKKQIVKKDLPQLENTRTITVATPLYRIAISEQAAAVKSIILTKYREKVEKDSPKKELIPKEISRMGGTFLTGLEKSNHEVAKSIFFADIKENDIYLKNKQKSIAFYYQPKSGINIIKTYTFDPRTYLIKLRITIQNQTGENINDKLVTVLRNKLATKKNAYGFEGPSALIDGKLLRVKEKNIQKSKNHSGQIGWIALEDRYFMTSLIPDRPVAADMKLEVQDQIVISKLIGPQFEIKANNQQSIDFNLFMGPKKLSILKSMNNGLDKAVKFGWFDFLAKPFLWFMNLIYKFIPNYGVSIIILTIISKLVVWPLGNKSYKSMNQMKRLQPLMNEIKEKYKDDKQKMNQEMMALYKTYKVNPMGGCLPMLLQIPVFFALYQMLYQAIELRHAPFIWWINDLSAPDRLFRFNFSVPFMEPPYGLPVLTIIMGATMILQQRMSPPPGDPAQAKMMMLMPIFFTVIFINFSSGLVLYWMVSNIISIAQQIYVQKKAV